MAALRSWPSTGRNNEFFSMNPTRILSITLLGALLSLTGCGKKTPPADAPSAPAQSPAPSIDGAVADQALPLQSAILDQNGDSGAPALPAPALPAPALPADPGIPPARPSPTNIGTVPTSAPAAYGVVGTQPATLNPDKLIAQIDALIAKLTAESQSLTGKKREEADARLKFLKNRREEEKKALYNR